VILGIFTGNTTAITAITVARNVTHDIDNAVAHDGAHALARTHALVFRTFVVRFVTPTPTPTPSCF
jgi:hypothetical protein